MKTISAILQDFGNQALIGCSVFFGVIKVYFLKYIFADFEFAGFLFSMVIFDSLLGIFFAIRNKDFDPAAFGQFMEKFVIYMAVLAVGHVITHYTVDGKPVETFAFLKSTLYSAMLIREVASILKFVGKRFPGFLRDVLKYFRGYTSEGLPESIKKRS